MQADLEIFTFQNIGMISKEPHLVDWETIGKEKDDDHTSEIVFLHHDTNIVEDGFEVVIYSNINIPNTDKMFVGTYNRYESNSTFYTSHNIVTDTMIAELTLSHLTMCCNSIFTDTNNKTNGQNPFMIKMPSISKLLLMIESDGQN